jgi:Fe-S-cluster-containing hydrogenase component 2/thioredoxin reductase/CRP-like cAMP-binding protein
MEVMAAPRLKASLVRLTPSGSILSRFPLTGAATTLGRSAQRDISIAEPWVSRHHADFVREDGRIVLVHRGMNETAVNGEIVRDRRVLQDRDEILLAGRIRLRIEVESEVSERAQSPALSDGTSPARRGLAAFLRRPSTAPAAVDDMASPSEVALAPSYSVVIVGGGPGGLAAGIRAAGLGLSHIVLERSALADTVDRYQRGKWVMDEPMRLPLQGELDMPFEASRREDVLDGWADAVGRAGVNLSVGPEFEVAGLAGERTNFRLTLSDGRQLRADHVVLAIGVQGNLHRFEVPGADLPHVTYQLDDASEQIGKRVVVIGAGDAALENALALSEEDIDVSLVNRGSEFPRAKQRNQKLIQTAIETRGIAYYPNSRVERFESNSVVLSTDDGETVLEAELVIGRLGASPPRTFLLESGVTIDSDDPNAVPEVSDQYQSSVSGLYLIGALAGYPLIKNSMNQGFEVIEHIAGRDVTPADESELDRKFAAFDGSVSENLERIQSTIPLFSSLTRIQLREFLFDSKIRRIRQNEKVYERNDFTTSSFAVLEGTMRGQGNGLREGTRSSSYSISTGLDVVVDRYGPGDFFGEESLLSGRRRAETVVAETDAIVIQTPRLTMARLINSSEDVRQIVNETSITRMLERLAPETEVADRHLLAARARILTFKPDEKIFREGEETKGLYLVRRGSVTISKRYNGKNVALEYVQSGNSIGEAPLLRSDGRHGATGTASLFTEVVLLPVEAVRPFLEVNVELRARLTKLVAEWAMLDGKAEARQSDTKIFLLGEGVAEATDLLLIDEALCIGCDECEKACAATHAGVSRLDRQGGPSYTTTRGSVLSVPVACRHCENPKCMDDCPPDALRRDPSGEVYIKDTCIGCGRCATNCPYDVIQMQDIDPAAGTGLLQRLLEIVSGPTGGAIRASSSDQGEAEIRSVAVKCDLCRELPANRHGKRDAACVATCPTGAIVRVDPSEYVEQFVR